MAQQPGKALLMVWTDIPAELEYDFNEWYIRDHVRERILGVPGFIRGRRFVSDAGTPKYLATYEAENIAVLTSEPYRALVRNPDALSRRFIPRFQHTIKGICDIAVEAGEAEGAALGMVKLTRAAGREADLRLWVRDALVPELMRQHGIVAVRYAEKNPAALAAGTAEHLRPTDRYIDAVLMIEAVSAQDLAAALPLVDDAALTKHGGVRDGEAQRLNLSYTLHVPPRGAGNTQ
jgi:hypothetical protein